MKRTVTALMVIAAIAALVVWVPTVKYAVVTPSETPAGTHTLTITGTSG